MSAIGSGLPSCSISSCEETSDFTRWVERDGTDRLVAISDLLLGGHMYTINYDTDIRFEEDDIK